jgi:hypothetical protein
MTPAEIVRLAESKNRIRRIEAQERASFDYIQASLIVKGVSITLGSKDNFPSLEEAYPNLFDDLAEQKELAITQEQKNILSTLRFKQFAQSYNSRFKEVPKKINE